MLEETRPDGNGRARGLVSSRVSGSRIEARTFAPHSQLREVVHCYWIARWDLREQPPHVVEILADPCINIVFEGGQSRVVGLTTRLFRRKLEGQGFIRAVKLRAGAARAVLGPGSMSDLSDRVVPLPSLLAAQSDALDEQILEPEDDQQAFANLERWVVSRVGASLDPKVVLAAKTVERIAADPNIITAEQVAQVCGVSLRPLQRLFRDYVGASPKWVVRRFRLQEAALRIEREDVRSLASLAAELGYSDHAHLSRDFKSATGRSPKAFLHAVGK